MALKRPKNEAVSKGDEPVPGRYSYRPAQAPPHSFWEVLAPGVAPLNTRAGHDRQIAELNQADKAHWVWRWQEPLRTDFDYPSFLAPELGAEHVALCIWICLDAEDRGIPLVHWLKTLKAKRQPVQIPDGKAMTLGKGHMFSPAGVDFAQGNTVHHETYAHPPQAALVALLANLEVRGQVELPADEGACADWDKAIEKRLADARSRFDALAGSRAGTAARGKASVGLLLQWFVHGRR